MDNKGKLYLLPVPIGGTPVWDVLPQMNRGIMERLRYFIVEDIRSARRFLSAAKLGLVIDELQFGILNEHTSPAEAEELIAPLLRGEDSGVISEAGVPGIADPGAEVVALAHKKGIEVIPLVGPSSIILALMASGLNGQSFAFNGYLPIKPVERIKAIRYFEKRALGEKQSQIFIETPYRNLKLLGDIVAACAPATLLTVAADILQPDQYIRTKTIAQWKGHIPPIDKRPAIFIIGAENINNYLH